MFNKITIPYLWSKSRKITAKELALKQNLRAKAWYFPQNKQPHKHFPRTLNTVNKMMQQAALIAGSSKRKFHKHFSMGTLYKYYAQRNFTTRNRIHLDLRHVTMELS